eukprot:TRINITY_DN4196_c2_g1_i1.p2 TRINITY_DN4196_c2_g1~~TRINITY_DN4196_c2_g1_i1.p2  ORF type:complete len:102 (+),score=8.10 TRINITY_DN4196_c2_g1_i1:50-355(+)
MPVVEAYDDVVLDGVKYMQLFLFPLPQVDRLGFSGKYDGRHTALVIRGYKVSVLLSGGLAYLHRMSDIWMPDIWMRFMDICRDYRILFDKRGVLVACIMKV